MLELQRKNQFFLFNFDKPQTNQECFFNPAFWQAQQRIVGSAKGRGTTWFIRSEDLIGVDAALRHYYRGGLWGRLNKDCYRFKNLAQTRSFAEFALLNKLYQAGIPVPKPIAARVEKTPFGCYRADILTQYIKNAQDLTALLQHADLSSEYWQSIGRLIRRLHDVQICHTDLNAHNILAQRADNRITFWLLDFDKCGEKAGNGWKRENLRRLHRSFVKETLRMRIRFNEDNWADLLAGYRQ
ncbi:3-deoxy-D-manno-octulosonic acid kinase [Pasteurellaceae bacterium LIM206]|nr:3-deoxy-D-manno-octulosonic acid kinase [Pasteurellaceae bacterium LIM206]